MATEGGTSLRRLLLPRTVTMGGDFHILLLTTTGRKSQRSRTVPLVYMPIEDSVVVVAANLGLDDHPGWYLNLKLNSQAQIQSGSNKMSVVAEDLSDDKREQTWKEWIKLNTGYQAFQAKTARKLPLVILKPAKPLSLSSETLYITKESNQMTSTGFLRYAGWSANVTATASIITFVSAILFFSIGQPFGTINDIASVFQVLFMLPLALILYRLNPEHAHLLNIVAVILGISGMITVVVGQSLLVVGVITYQQSLSFVPAGAAIGGWLVLMSSKLLPRRLALTGVLAGIGYLMTVVGFLFGGQESPIFYAGGLILVISYPLWAFWLGRVCLSGKLIAFA